MRVFDDSKDFYGFASGTTYSTDLIAAATICKEWGADVINLSLGGSNYNKIEELFFQDLFYESGIITVAASGNGGDDTNVYPAAYDGVLSVGAVDESMTLAHFSTWNRQTTDVLAPGVNILSTFKNNDYRTFSGTSMANPHATGALALMLCFVRNKTERDFSAQDLFDAIKNTLVSTSHTSTSSFPSRIPSSDPIGVINVYAAILYLESENENNDNRQRVEGRMAPLPLESEEISNDIECAKKAQLDITTDSKGFEIYYRLKRLSDDHIIWMAKPDTLNSNSRYTETLCLEEFTNDCYLFDIRDKGKDGISDSGGIVLLYDGEELYRGSDFGSGGRLEFGSSC